MDKTRTTIYINKELYKQLKLIAIEKETSTSKIIEELIKEYVKKES